MVLSSVVAALATILLLLLVSLRNQTRHGPQAMHLHDANVSTCFHCHKTFFEEEMALGHKPPCNPQALTSKLGLSMFGVIVVSMVGEGRKTYVQLRNCEVIYVLPGFTPTIYLC